MDGSQIEIRAALEADLYDLIELEMGTMPDRPDAAGLAAERQCDRLERQQREEVLFLLSECKGQIVGQLVLRLAGQPDRWGLTRRKDFADIEDVRVLARFRGRGLASAMVSQAEWQSMREGVNQIGVSIDINASPDLVAWFERRDYIRADEVYRVEPGLWQDLGGGQGDRQATYVDLIKEL
jgi:GNAT superfamily N-acetyltransferase